MREPAGPRRARVGHLPDSAFDAGELVYVPFFPGRRSLALIGKSLRDARVQRGISIEQVAQETRISPRFLQALEDERFDELPAPVYVRGFLRSYANFLQLDPEPLVAELTGVGPRGASPDAFVPGPAVPAGQRVRRPNSRSSRDPFARQAPARSGQGEAVAPMPEPPIVLPRPSTIEADAWAPEPEDDAPEPAAYRPRGVAVAPPPEIVDEDFDDEAAFAPEEETYRSRRVSGMLVERPEPADSSGRITRIVALVGIGVLVLIAGLAAAVFLTRGGDDGDKAASATSTATPKPTNIIAITGSPTASPSPAASPSVSPTASVSATASVSPSPTGTETPGATPGTPAPTATRSANTPAPTQPAATATNAPAPTNTPIPPTSTPTRVPTPAPTPTTPIIQPGSQGYSECVNGDCGDSPYRVVCAPSGWFLDRQPYFPAEQYRWVVVTVEKTGQAQYICGN
ncbi:MAG: helix-turn-helix domain-containing protein [Dehalococcoidia bacterium]|nr:helix-turn-helix domain-containing protein [Dehalococcoidia bacterium]